MIQAESVILAADNSGAKEILVIRVCGGSGRRYARVGDTITGVVKVAGSKGQVKKGEIVLVVIVRTVRPIKRADGSVIRFDENAGVILGKEGNPKASRIFGPIPRELRDKQYLKIISLAEEVV